MLGGFGQPVLPPPRGGLPAPLLGDLGPTSTHQPRPEEGGSGTAVGVSEFRRVCSWANLTVCAPPCNPASDGFLLSVRGRAIRLHDCLISCSFDRLIACLLSFWAA
jgi:hypothetical protein